MTKADCLKTFNWYKRVVDQDYKAGNLTREQARHFLEEARKNYSNMNAFREIEKHR